MVKYKTEFKLIEGDKVSFEKECNSISDTNWVWGGNMVATPTENGIIYSMLFTKTTPIS